MPSALIAGYRPPPQASQSAGVASMNRQSFSINQDDGYSPGPPMPAGDWPLGRTRNNGTPPPMGVPTYNGGHGAGPRNSQMSTMSEQTNFTSISQRPINPRWNTGPGPSGPNGPQQNRNRPTLLLSGNPDFELPNLPQQRKNGPRGPGPRNVGMMPSNLGEERGGRYPQPPPNMGR